MGYSLTGVGRMKILIALLGLSSIAYGDAGVSIGYRSVPTVVYKNVNVMPKHRYDTVNGVYRRTINVMTINIYFDDTLKAHDKDKDEKKKNKKSRWPRALRVSKGAGYIMGFNFNYGAEEGLVEYYSGDFYIGKRIFIVPHLFHLYFKIGPSVARFNYDMVSRYLAYTKKFGGFYNIGAQMVVLKGIKIYAEAEFRAYSVASYEEFNIERNKTEFDNSLPGWTKNYRSNRYNKSWLRGLITDGLRIGIKFNF